jgi:hypothetical protein
MLYPDRVSSGPYLDSAHGSSYGVLRTSLSTPPNNYGQGNCAHCHEQHSSIGGSEPVPNSPAGPSKWCLLANNFSGKTTNPYAQSDSVCFYCHIVTGTYQSPAFYNYSYSITFAGNPDITPNNIFNTFNSTSYHNQYDVFRFITGLSGSHPNFSNFPSDSNPCSGCHNVHIAQRSCGKPTGSYDPTKSAISRPSDHSNLWGDDTTERMNNYTANYQAPYWYGSTTNYEPDNYSVSEPDKLPNYVTFCTDCHNATNTIYSTTLGRKLKTIDWNTEKHGKGNADVTITMKSPYGTVMGKVLSCTDCHEPHGSPNVFLLRNEVNGGVLSYSITAFSLNLCSFPGTDGNKVLGWFCRSCHKDDAVLDNNPALVNQWKYTHHYTNYTTDAPYERTRCGRCHWSGSGEPITCNCCHYHGSSTTDYGSNYPCYVDPIVCDDRPPIDRRTF